MVFKQFPWVQSGTYDHRKHSIRYEIVDGYVKTMASKMWLDLGGPSGTSEQFRTTAWGDFPDMPANPDKRKV